MKSDSPTVPIETVLGAINASEGSGKAYLFHSPHALSVRAGEKETYASTAMSECPSLGIKGSVIKLPARKNIRTDIGKEVFQTTLVLKEGEVFKVFAQSSALGERWNQRARTACQFIRVRADAPLNKLLVKVPGTIKDSTFEHWFIRGRFDVLTLAQAEEIGINVPEGVRDHFLSIPVEALFEVEEIEKERRPAAVAETIVKKVGDRAMTIARPRRSLNLEQH